MKGKVLGAGPMGVLCMITARAMGATHILLTDVVESRLETAKKMGADHTLLIKPEYSEQDVVDKILTAVGDAPDVSIDACGYPSAQAVAMRATQAGGTVVIVGIGPDRAEVPLAAAMLREVDVRGSYRIANTSVGKGRSTPKIGAMYSEFSWRDYIWSLARIRVAMEFG
ncbi:hypothetical protein evm_015505 [Chilo suppressalis]|nr:hypothetical protein evm_015505 [Chilo suppressalis]